MAIYAEELVAVEYTSSTNATTMIQGIKELVDQNGHNVPSIYVHPSYVRPCFNEVSHTEQIPVIDLADLFAADKRSRVVKEIGRACDEWAFFQVINHGVAESVIQGIRTSAQKFFDLPPEERMQLYSNRPNLLCPVSYTTSFNLDLEKVRDWRDVLRFRRADDQEDGFELAPEICRESLLEYRAAVEKLANSVYDAIFESLGLRADYLETELERIPWVSLDINYYPRCADPSLTLGLSAHTDLQSLTVLHAGEVGGLHVHKGEKWVAVQPLPNAFVINVGDQIEIMTNGKYQSVEHRVVTNIDKPRMSLACFFGPSEHAKIAPLSKLVDENNPARYQPRRFRDYLNNFSASKVLYNRETLDFAKLRSQEAIEKKNGAT